MDFLKVLKLYHNNWTDGYEEEVLQLSAERQIFYYSHLNSIDEKANRAVVDGFPKVLKYLALEMKGIIDEEAVVDRSPLKMKGIIDEKDVTALEMGECDIFLKTIKIKPIEKSIFNDESRIRIICRKQPLLVYDMLRSLGLNESNRHMYRNFTDPRDEIGTSVSIFLNRGSYFISGSDDMPINNSKNRCYWSQIISSEENNYSSYKPKDNKVHPTEGESTHSAKEESTQTVESTHFPVVSYTLPFQYMSSYEFLKAYIYIADQTKNKDLFDNENIKVAVIAAWEDYAQRYHIGLCIVYMAYLSLLTYSNYAYQSKLECFSELISVVCFSGLLSIMEFIQWFEIGFYDYIKDIQNVLEVCGCLLVMAGSILRLQDSDSNILISEEIMAVASILAWFNALNFLRPFVYTGPLIQMIHAVTAKIIPFFLILMIVIFGFSQAFFILADPNYSEFSTMDNSYLHSYVYITAGAHYVNTGEEKNKMMITLIVIYIAFIQILLLNLLIAFLSHIYQDIQDKADAVGSYERCKIIISQVRPWRLGVPMKGKRWIHFLKSEADVKAKEKEEFDQESTNEMLNKSHIEDLNTMEILKNKIDILENSSIQQMETIQTIAINLNDMKKQIDNLVKKIESAHEH